MQKFVALYIGTSSAFERAKWNEMDEQTRKKREEAGMKAWQEWGVKHAKAIVDQGSPLGRTKRVGRDGITDITNTIAAYVVVQAESHEAAAQLFEGHPHFAIFPGDSVEIMPCTQIPQMPG
jgi:hypothetical protein